MSKKFFIRMEDMTVVNEMAEDEEGAFVLIQKLEDITGYLTDDQIFRLYKGIYLGDYSWETQLTVDELAEKCYKSAQGSIKKPIKKKPVKEVSKIDLIRGAFEHRQIISEKDLCIMTGEYNIEKLRMFINMLSNKAITKNSLDIKFSETELSYKLTVDK
jgi:hypothetical protein